MYDYLVWTASILCAIVGDYMLARNGYASVAWILEVTADKLFVIGTTIGIFVAKWTTIFLDYADLVGVLAHVLDILRNIFRIVVAPVWAYLLGYIRYLEAVNIWMYSFVSLFITTMLVYYFVGTAAAWVYVHVVLFIGCVLR